MVNWLAPLDKKALRDMWHMRGQILAVSLIIASGVAVLVMSLSTLESLDRTTAAYYERYRFGHVFAQAKRVPEQMMQRIAAIEGVQTAESRVMQFATLDLAGFNEPAMAQLVSVPADQQPKLNRLVIRQGRWIQAHRNDEVLIAEPFAEAHGLVPGDRIDAVLKGHRRTLTVVGVALSPEFVYSLGPGALMPDDERFTVMWMGREALAAAFDLEGAFNNVSLILRRGAAPEAVIPQLDRLLEPFGSTGAIARADQMSNWFVMNEMDQLRTMSSILPTIFLAIAAFLTNMLLGRLLATERSQIGLLKAFGYSHWEVGVHYGKIVLGLAMIGIVVGGLLGSWLGLDNTRRYADLFRFPLLLYQPSLWATGVAAAATLIAAYAGAAHAVYRAVRLAPAQAMLPPRPPVFKRTRLARTRLGRWFDQPTRIILRNISRWPGRAALTVVGIATSVALLILSMQWTDSLDYLAESYFFDAQRQHVMIGLADPQAPVVLKDVARLPAVLATEPLRIVSADLQVGVRKHRGGLTGVPELAVLQPIYDDARQVAIAAPRGGLVLGSYLADKLRVGVGDLVWVRVLEGRRPELHMPVVEIIDTYIGMPAFVHMDTLNRLLKDGPRVEYISLLVDRALESELYTELKSQPLISAVMVRQAAVDSFHDTVVEHIMVFITIFSTLACLMGFGVAYNSARITLSERGRELATLRVLGFTRGEISYILLGEVGMLIAVALPLGCWLGEGLARAIASGFDTELFRVPLAISPATYGLAVSITIAATLLSALIVRARVDRLDLIEVLKSRE